MPPWRYDERTKQRGKTVEWTEWGRESKSADGEAVVAVRVCWQETALQRKVKAIAGKWDPTDDT